MIFSLFKKPIELKVVVIGNCQSQVIATLIRDFNPTIEILTVAVVHLLKTENSNEYIEHFDRADLIFTQLISDDYPCEFVRTNYLKEAYGNKVTTLLNLYYSGYTPDWFYIRSLGQGNLRGPMGDYHNRTIFDSWKSGKSPSTAANLIEDLAFNEHYRLVGKKSLEELKNRESGTDVKIVDFIQERLQQDILFFTFNHPKLDLLVELVRRALTYQGLKILKNRNSFRSEPLGLFRPMINPACQLSRRPKNKFIHQGILYPESNLPPHRVHPVQYKSSEISEIFYGIYEKHADQLRV